MHSLEQGYKCARSGIGAGNKHEYKPLTGIKYQLARPRYTRYGISIMKRKASSTLAGIGATAETLPSQIKDLRKKAGLTQEALAKRTGVGLRFVRDVEQGKATVRLDKVNQVLVLFGYHVAAVKDS